MTHPLTANTIGAFYSTMATVAHFQQHYNDLQDEELVQIALTRELVPEAQQALTEELSKRGINDLSKYKALMAQETEAEEDMRQKHIAHRSRTSGWFTKIAYAIGLVALLYGVFRAVFPSNTARGDEGMIAGGLAIIFFAWLRARISKIWVENVLYRKPSR